MPLLLYTSIRHPQIGSLVTLLALYFLISKTSDFLSRNEETHVFSAHKLLLTSIIFFSGSLSTGLGPPPFLYPSLITGTLALAISANFIGLTYRTSFFIACLTPLNLFLSLWLGQTSQKLIIQALLS